MVRIILFLLGLFMSFSSFSQVGSLRDGLIAYYRFEESNNGVIREEVRELNGTLENSTAIFIDEGLKGLGAVFNYTGYPVATISLTDFYSYFDLDNGTISVWFLSPTSTSSDVIFSVSDKTTASTEWILRVNIGIINISCRRYQGYLFDANGPRVDDNMWHHLAFMVSPTGNKCFLDGNEVSLSYSYGSSFTRCFLDDVHNANTANIGSNEDNGGTQWLFEGKIDELMIYDRALSPLEIKNLYNYQLGVLFP